MGTSDRERPAVRPGEALLDADPALMAADAGLVFIGRIRTPWGPEGGCPHSVRVARELTPQTARIELVPNYRPALAGLARHSHVIVLYWMDRARRDLATQVPRGAPAARGTFALRTPNRPNPVALAVAAVASVDAEAGVVEVEMLDCYDGTPLLDIKPYIATVDSVPGAGIGG